MTAPTLSIYPRTVDELMPEAHALVARLGTVPSRNRIKTELRVGGPKADAIIDRLTRPPVDSDPAPTGTDPDAGAADGPPVDLDPHPDADAVDPPTPDAPTAPVPPAPPVVGTAPDVAEVPGVVSGQAAPVADPGSNITTTPTTTRAAGRPSGRGWAYVGVILGGVVSIAANVAHTYLPKSPDGAPAGWASDPGWSPSPLAVALSVFWPVALFVTVEILTRIPWGDGISSVFARVAGVLPVAVVAAVVSYRHLSGLLAHFGEDPLTIAIGPLAVDGLMVMASAALLVTSRRSRT